MSKIALTPNASGTGIFTIASPNSNTNRTLSLPDETGTVLTSGGAIDVNASAPADSLAINASGNVGIGTSSPAQKLDVQAADYVAVRALSTNNSIDTRLQSYSTGNYGYAGTVSNHSFSFITNNAERVRIDTSGNVGIGTSSPNQPLSVYGANGFIQMLNASTGTTSGDGALIGVEGGTTALRIANQENDAITFHTNGLANERARIDSSGNLLVGKTATSATTVGCQLNAAGTAFFVQTSTGDGPLTQFVNINASTPDGYRFASFRWNTGGTEIGTISKNSASAVAYNTTSDYRLKQDIAPMTGALAKVQALKPVTYKWKLDGSDGQGFIAHELQEVCPDAVTGSKDAVDEEGNPRYQGIDTSFLVATLTAAIQEQQAIIESLTARIAALEGAA